MDLEDRRRLARLRMRARRQRDGQLRRRAIVLALAMFAVLWVAVFAQMVSGHDPVLGNGTQVAAVTRNSSQQAQGHRSAGGGGELALDPETGEIVEVAPSSSSTAAPAPAPKPAPVVTSQS